MQLRSNHRLDPTPGQRIASVRAFGCARAVFNDGLRIRQQAHAVRIVLAAGRAERQNACGGSVSPSVRRKAGPDETGTRLEAGRASGRRGGNLPASSGRGRQRLGRAPVVPARVRARGDARQVGARLERAAARCPAGPHPGARRSGGRPAAGR
ncbi:helix-turn-helix domain-containing protein [Streptomyces sp. NPDC058625]